MFRIYMRFPCCLRRYRAPTLSTCGAVPVRSGSTISGTGKQSPENRLKGLKSAEKRYIESPTIRGLGDLMHAVSRVPVLKKILGTITLDSKLQF